MGNSTGKPVTVSSEVAKRDQQNVMSCCGSAVLKSFDECVIENDILTPCKTLQQMIKRDHEKDGFEIDSGVIKHGKTDRNGHYYLKKLNFCPYCGSKITQ